MERELLAFYHLQITAFWPRSALLHCPEVKGCFVEVFGTDLSKYRWSLVLKQ
jgi:hypothetical protein